MDNYCVIYAVIIFCVQYCVCDYDCLCNYNVEKVVYESADASGKLIGYLYEFDCKPLISAADLNWATIAIEHKVGFVEKDDKTQMQICPGTVPDEDKLLLTTQTILPTTVTTDVTSTTQPMQPATREINEITTSLLTQSASPMVLFSDIITSSMPSLTSVSSPLFASTSKQIPTNTVISILSKSTTSVKTTPSTLTSSYITFSNTQSPVSKQAIDLPSSTTSTLNLQNNTLSGTPNNNVYTSLSSLSNTITETVTSDQIFANLSDHSTPLTSVASTATNGDLIKNNFTSLPNISMTIPTDISIISQLLSSTLKAMQTTSTSTEQATYISQKIPSATTSQSPPTLSETTPFSTANSTPGIFADRVDLCPYQYLALSTYNKETRIYPMFRQYGKYCYELRLERKDWFEAQSDCRTRGGDLAEIADSATQERIYDMISTAVKGYKPDIWIGLNDLKREGQWEWSDGNRFTKDSLINEVHGDPIYSDLHDCFLMDGNNGYWKNTACRTFLLDTQLHPWVCQYKILSQ